MLGHAMNPPTTEPLEQCTKPLQSLAAFNPVDTPLQQGPPPPPPPTGALVGAGGGGLVGTGATGLDVGADVVTVAVAVGAAVVTVAVAVGAAVIAVGGDGGGAGVVGGDGGKILSSLMAISAQFQNRSGAPTAYSGNGDPQYPK